jgi:CRP-like cAMP-binding protein
VTQQFSLDRSVFEELSLVSGSTERYDFFDDNRLSGQQRLFFQVWASQALQVGVFGSGHALTKAGEVPVYGYVITSGEARAFHWMRTLKRLFWAQEACLALLRVLPAFPPCTR